VAIVHAAGGSATDLDGSPLDFAHGRELVKNRGMVVSSGGALHEKILEGLVGMTLDG
jgi:3'-phosphoadenosine 5'-phosphosulfate (PAPS) 3'-phosphatase